MHENAIFSPIRGGAYAGYALCWIRHCVHGGTNYPSPVTISWRTRSVYVIYLYLPQEIVDIPHHAPVCVARFCATQGHGQHCFLPLKKQFRVFNIQSFIYSHLNLRLPSQFPPQGERMT